MVLTGLSAPTGSLPPERVAVLTSGCGCGWSILRGEREKRMQLAWSEREPWDDWRRRSECGKVSWSVEQSREEKSGGGGKCDELARIFPLTLCSLASHTAPSRAKPHPPAVSNQVTPRTNPTKTALPFSRKNGGQFRPQDLKFGVGTSWLARKLSKSSCGGVGEASWITAYHRMSCVIMTTHWYKSCNSNNYGNKICLHALNCIPFQSSRLENKWMGWWVFYSYVHTVCLGI